MLSERYPNAYGPDSSVQWLVLPEDLYQFLFATRCKNTIRIVLALLQARDFENPSNVVWRRDKELRRATGLTGLNWNRSLTAPDLLDLVDIERGQRDSKGRPGTATKYDLSPLWVALENWRSRPPKKKATDPTIPF